MRVNPIGSRPSASLRYVQPNVTMGSVAPIDAIQATLPPSAGARRNIAASLMRLSRRGAAFYGYAIPQHSSLKRTSTGTYTYGPDNMPMLPTNPAAPATDAAYKTQPFVDKDSRNAKKSRRGSYGNAQGFDAELAPNPFALSFGQKDLRDKLRAAAGIQTPYVDPNNPDNPENWFIKAA